MQQFKACYDHAPSETEGAPTLYIVRANIERIIETTEEGDSLVRFECDELRLTAAEYQQVRAGILPGTVPEWTPELRRIERGALLDKADTYLAEAEDHIAVGDNVPGWSAYKAMMHSYKIAVRNTASAAGFPLVVTYPELPVQP